MKINLNILKEEEEKEDFTTRRVFDRADVVYSPNFDEMVKIINSKAKMKKARKSRPLSGGDNTGLPQDLDPIEVDSGYRPTGDTTYDQKLSPTGLEKKGEIPTDESVIFPEEYKAYSGTVDVYPPPEDLSADEQPSYKFNVKSKVEEGEGSKDIYSVVLKDSDYEPARIIGSIINIPEKGYLISTKEVTDKTAGEIFSNVLIPDDINTSNWPSANDNFSDFSYSYENSIKILFKIVKHKLPEDDEALQDIRKMPEDFADPIETPMFAKKYTKLTRSQNFDWYVVSTAATLYNNRNDVSDKKQINTESHVSRVLGLNDLDGTTRSKYVGMSIDKTLEDICSLAAMIMIETGNQLEHAPFGTAAVAFHRVDSSKWGDTFYHVLSGPPQPGRGGSAWNNGQKYKDRFKRYYNDIRTLYLTETELGKEADVNKEKTSKNYNTMKERPKKSIRLAIDFATTSIDRKGQIIKRYRNAYGFIHPARMPETLIKNSYNNIKFNFNTQKFPDSEDGSDVEYEISNNPKIHGVRYIGKHVAKNIKSGKAFFFPNETALFQTDQENE
jgi:hypothetical protein